MEVLVIILMAITLCLRNAQEVEYEEEEILVRETRLNPDFYVDENAFMEVANVLGFGSDTCDTSDSDIPVRLESIHSVSSHTEDNVRNENDRNGVQAEDINGAGSGRVQRVDRMARANN